MTCKVIKLYFFIFLCVVAGFIRPAIGLDESSPYNIKIQTRPQDIVAILKSSSAKPYAIAVNGIRDVLNKECADVKLLEFTLEEKGGDLHLCKTIKANNPQLILTVGTKATEIAIQEMRNIPIVYSMVLNPEDSGFVTNGIAGVSLNVSASNVYEITQRIFPGVKTIGVIHKSLESRIFIENSKEEADKLGLELVNFAIDSRKELRTALKQLSERADVLWMIPTSIYTPQVTKEILFYTLREGIPVIGLSPLYVKAGALFSLSCDYKDIGHQAGEMAVRVLGGKSLDNAVMLPRTTILSLNLIVAERLGAKIPGKLARKAKFVYGQGK